MAAERKEVTDFAFNNQTSEIDDLRVNEGVVDCDQAAQSAVALKNSSMTLTSRQAKGLYRRVRNRALHAKEDTDTSLKSTDSEGAEQKAEHAASHGHAEKPHSIVTATASALINFLLMFGLCCAYGMILFSDPFNKRHIGLGIKMNIGTALIFGLLLSSLSKVPVAIGGPDLNPVVFLGGFIEVHSRAIAENLALDMAATGSGHRRLAGGGSSDEAENFCEPDWIHDNSDHRRLADASADLPSHSELFALCEEYHAQLRATTVFTTVVSTALLGLIFFLLGKFKLSRYVSYVPTSVQEAFLSCIGYKVFKYALTFCQYDLNQFIPAACVGVPLYFLKAYHIGNPAIVMPLGLLVPLGIFYAIIYGIGEDIDTARENDWFFPVMANADWYGPWTDGFLQFDKVQTQVWLKTLPDLIIMIIVIVLDCMLKISSTETKMPIKTDKNYEISLYGVGNVLTVLLGQSVGYMQLKFNVINYGVLGNITDRRAGAIYAIFCGICFFWTTELINFLPRFFLGSLLFFAGAGFVCENLWGSRKYLNFVEWMEILIILGVFILTGSLLYAVGVGVVLTIVTFIRKYAAVPAISGRPLRGAEVATHDSLGPLAQKSMAHIANSWLLVTKLRGFVFFASVQGVTEGLIKRIEAEKALPEFERMKYAVFDCESLDGLDVSAAKAMKRLTNEAAALGVHVYFCSLSPGLQQDFVMREIITDLREVFPQLGEAVLFIEEQIMSYCKELQSKWVELHPAFALNLRMQLGNEGFDPFQGVLIGDASRFNSPWRYCSRRSITKYRTVLWLNGEANQNLYLVHSGTIGLFNEIPDRDSKNPDDWSSPVKIYGHGCFLNLEALALAQTRTSAVALQSGELVYWTQEQWWKMSREQPIMVRDILRAVMRQQVTENAAGVLEHKPNKAVVDKVDQGSQTAVNVSPSPSSFRDSSAKTVGKEASLGVKAKTKMLEMMSAISPATPAVQSSDEGESFNREVSDIIMAQKSSGDDSRSEKAEVKAFIPMELQVVLQEMEAAASLHANGFFEPVADDKVAEHPPLSAPMQRDVHNAFVTYAEWGDEVDDAKPKPVEDVNTEAEPMIPWHSVETALKYAGIFNSLTLDKADHPTKLTEAQFTEIAHHSAMAKLSQQHLDTISATFQEHDLDGSKTLDLGELSQVFQKTMHPNHNINVETVDGIAAGFTVHDTGGSGGKITEASFVKIMSRYIKKHEYRWLLLKGILDVTGKNYSEVTSAAISYAEVEQAVMKHGHESTLQRIREMLWASDWTREGAGDGDTLTFEGFVAALNTAYGLPAQGLPPPPNVARGVAPHQGLDPHRKPEGFRAEDWMVDFRSALDDVGTHQHLGDRRHSESSALLLQDDGDDKDSDAEPPVETLRYRIREAFEDPNSSTTASIVSTVTGILILVSVLTLIVQPVVAPPPVPPEQEPVWYAFEFFFTIIFSLELLIRFSVCTAGGKQTYLEFISTPTNITDVIAVIPGWIEIIWHSGEEEMRLLRIIRMARLSRMARIARLAKKSTLAAPVSMVMVVIWGIYMKHGLAKKLSS